MTNQNPPREITNEELISLTRRTHNNILALEFDQTGHLEGFLGINANNAITLADRLDSALKKILALEYDLKATHSHAYVDELEKENYRLKGLVRFCYGFITLVSHEAYEAWKSGSTPEKAEVEAIVNTTE